MSLFSAPPLPRNVVLYSQFEMNSINRLETILPSQMELDQLLQFRKLEMVEGSLLLLFPKLIRIDEETAE